MRDSVTKISLDILNSAPQVQITAQKGDTARTLRITLHENGKPYLPEIPGSKAAVAVHRNDGTFTSRLCDIAADGTIKYTFNAYTADETGLRLCELKLYRGDELLYAPRFYLLVDGEIAEDVDLRPLTRVLDNETARQEAEKARAAAETKRADAEKARVTAEDSRAAAETERISAEEQRVLQESSRAETISQLNDILKGLNLALGQLSVDTAISAGSVNPVTNKAIADAFQQVGVYTPTWAQGSISNASGSEGTEITSDVRIRTSYIYVTPGEKIRIFYPSGYTVYVWSFAGETYSGITQLSGSGAAHTIGSTITKIRLTMKKGSGETIVPANGDAVLVYRENGALLEAIARSEAKTEAAAMTYAGSFADGVFGDVRPVWNQGSYDGSGDPTDNSARVRTRWFSIPERFLKVTVPDGMWVIVMRLINGVRTYTTFTKSFYTYCYSKATVSNAEADVQWAFVLRRANGNDLTPGDAGGVRFTKIDPDAREEIGHGVFSAPTDFAVGFRMTDNVYTQSGNWAASRPIRIPRSGLKIAISPDYVTDADGWIDDDDVPTYNVTVLQDTDHGLTDPDDATFATANAATTHVIGESCYIPYTPNAVVIISLYNRYKEGVIDPGLDLTGFTDYLLVWGGEIGDAGGKPLNLFPVRLKMTYDPDNADPTKRVRFDIGNYLNNALWSSMRYFATFINLRDVKRIVASPQTELLAEIWKTEYGDSGITQSKYATVFGREPIAQSQSATNKGVGKIGGVPVIDFSEYDFDGYAIVAFRCPLQFYASGAAGSETWGVRSMGMGFLRGYAEIEDGVFVEYRPGCHVSRADGMPAKLAENIREFTRYTLPKTMEGDNFVYIRGHVSQRFPSMREVTPAWYAGSFDANSVFLHLSGKSYVTSALNPNSRWYQHAWRDPNDPDDDTNVIGHTGYGLTCTDFVEALMGMEVNYTTHAMVYGDNAAFEKISTSWNYQTDWDLVKPGDLLVTYQVKETGGYSGHVVMVRDKVYLNNALVCVTAYEGHAPFARIRTFFDTDYLKEIVTSTDSEDVILGFCSMSYLAPYTVVLRAKPDAIRNIRTAYFEKPSDMRTDYTVGTVMCDRGTDSVYCLSSKYIYLSVSDDSATQLILHRDGDDPEDDVTVTIPTSELLGLQTQNGLRVVNVKQYVTRAGLYSVKTDKSDDVQETFYVPENLPYYEETACDADGNPQTGGAYRRFRFATDYLQYITVMRRYIHRTDPETGKLITSTGYLTLLPSDVTPEVINGNETGYGTIVVPYEMEIDGRTSTLFGPRFVYKAIYNNKYYGSYWMGLEGNRIWQSQESEVAIYKDL